MTTTYYSVSGAPATSSAGSSATMRSEFALIEAGFALLPSLTSAGNRIPHINSGSTAQTTTSGFTFDGTTFTAPAMSSTGVMTLGGALTYGGVTLSNSVTGTGSMMLSASPTTTGTLTAAAITASGNGSFGPGGSASAQTTITANGSSANTYGPGIYLQRNSVSKGVLATESQLAANNSDNIWLYAYAGASLKLYGGGNLGQTIDASGNVSMPGTLGVTGTATMAAINASGALTGITGVFTGAGATPALSNGNLVVSSGTTTGAIIAGKGSSTDLYLANSSYQAVLTVAAGTTNVTIPNGTFAVTNNATVGGTLGVTGTATMAAINASGTVKVNGPTNANARIFAVNGYMELEGAAGAVGIEFKNNTSGNYSYLSSEASDVFRLYSPGNVDLYAGAVKTLSVAATGASVTGTLAVSSTLTAVPGGTSHLNASGGRVYIAGNSSAIGLGLGYNKTRTDATQTVFFGATDSATPDGVVSNSVGTEIVRFSNTGMVQTDGQYQIRLAGVTKWQMYHDSGTSQFRIYDTNGAADVFKIATGGEVAIPGTLGVTGNFSGTTITTSTSDGINSHNANPAIFDGIGSAAGTAAIIDANGRLYKLTSSRRYKENISPMAVTPEQLSAFVSTAPCFWDYKQEEGSLAVGRTGLASFIAEDLAELAILRDGRSVLNNYDAEGRPDSNRDAALIGLQHLVLQDHEARLSALQAEFQAYKAAHP